MTKERVVEYVVKLDGEFYEAFATLKLSRQCVKDLPVKIGISNMPKKIEIVKSITETTVLNEYFPKYEVVLKSSDAFDKVNLA